MSSPIRSSIARVEIGSRAEHGSSISRTSGSTAIEDLIGELKETYTIVIVTHNMQQAARVSDRTGFFSIAGAGEPGRLVEMDDTDVIFSRPAKQETEDYISGRFG